MKMKPIDSYLEYFSEFDAIEDTIIYGENPYSHHEGSVRKVFGTPVKKQFSKDNDPKISKVTPKLAKLIVEDLCNGLTFYCFLSRVSGVPPMDINCKPQTFSDNFANLKVLYKGIECYWQKQLQRQIQCGEIDLVDIAKNFNEQELEKLCQLLVKTAFQAENSLEFIQKVLNTSEETQTFFQKLIEQKINKKNAESPMKLMKQQKNRLYDKLMEMENESNQLYKVTHQICLQKKELQQKNQYLLQRLNQKQKQLQKLGAIVGQFYTETPQRQRIDFGEKQIQKIQKLQNKLVEMTKNYEKTLSAKQQQIDSFSLKIERLNELETMRDQSREKIADANAALSTVAALETTIRRNLAILKDKEEQISQLTVQLTKESQRIQDLQEREMEYRVELQRKSVQLEESLKLSEITKKHSRDPDEDFLPICQSMTIHKSLSQQCPQIMNNISDDLLQTSRALKTQLERAKKTILGLQGELSSQKAELQNGRTLEKQNKRLTGILKDLIQHRGQENQMLTGCLYELRMAAGVKMERKEVKNLKSPQKLVSLKNFSKVHQRKPLGRAILN